MTEMGLARVAPAAIRDRLPFEAGEEAKAMSSMLGIRDTQADRILSRHVRTVPQHVHHALELMTDLSLEGRWKTTPSYLCVELDDGILWPAKTRRSFVLRMNSVQPLDIDEDVAKRLSMTSTTRVHPVDFEQLTNADSDAYPKPLSRDDQSLLTVMGVAMVGDEVTFDDHQLLRMQRLAKLLNLSPSDLPAPAGDRFEVLPHRRRSMPLKHYRALAKHLPGLFANPVKRSYPKKMPAPERPSPALVSWSEAHGEALRAAREHMRLTQAEFCEKSGLKSSSLNPLERGERDSIRLVTYELVHKMLPDVFPEIPELPPKEGRQISPPTISRGNELGGILSHARCDVLNMPRQPVADAVGTSESNIHNLEVNGAKELRTPLRQRLESFLQIDLSKFGGHRFYSNLPRDAKLPRVPVHPKGLSELGFGRRVADLKPAKSVPVLWQPMRDAGVLHIDIKGSPAWLDGFHPQGEWLYYESWDVTRPGQLIFVETAERSVLGIFEKFAVGKLHLKNLATRKPAKLPEADLTRLAIVFEALPDLSQ